MRLECEKSSAFHIVLFLDLGASVILSISIWISLSYICEITYQLLNWRSLWKINYTFSKIFCGSLPMCHLHSEFQYRITNKYCILKCIIIFFYIYLFIWPHQVLVVALGIFSCSMWDLVPWPGIKPSPCIGSLES